MPTAKAPTRTAGKTYKGTSTSVQKALDLAVLAAQQAARGNDRIIEWSLTEISGRQGGLAPVKETTVVIKARVV